MVATSGAIMKQVLSLDMIKAAGALTSQAPIKREIEWTVGADTFKADVYVRQLSYQSYLDVMRNGIAKDDLALATRIAASVCDEAGKPIFTVDDIVGGGETGHGGLCESLIKALWIAVIAASLPEKKQVADKKLAKKKKSG